MLRLVRAVMSAILHPCAAIGLVLLCGLSAVSGTAVATSVRETSMAEMAERSAVIFEGVVVDVRAHRSAHGAIVTAVVFEILDVIKGSVPQRRLTLEFLGGTLPGERQAVAAMRYPEPGEKGIYFAEAIDRPLINPLYGWDQGRFLIQDDRVFTADRRPVAEVSGTDTAFFDTPTRVTAMSTGVARGVRAGDANASVPGLSTPQFKQRIRNLLGGAP
jgi:hypothetical protein